jgi:hypothetical protein
LFTCLQPAEPRDTWQPQSCPEPGRGARAAGTRAVSGAALSQEREPGDTWRPRSYLEPGGGARAAGTRDGPRAAPSWEPEPESWGHVAASELLSAGRREPLS